MWLPCFCIWFGKPLGDLSSIMWNLVINLKLSGCFQESEIVMFSFIYTELRGEYVCALVGVEEVGEGL